MKKIVGNQENLKYAHAEVQDQFAKILATILENQSGAELQCCVTYTKPCGCIRKYVLGGEKWKEDSSLQLKNSDDFDSASVVARDKSMIGPAQVERARELLGVYEHAAELKKEKCYAFNNAEVEGKSLKELRGMIGLGNGRKRSKKYEEYVLQIRSKLRNQYFLCEKAAQKLLGYSINFLYKKLRTNPQKTSRLVATNKAERASKAPRHLIPLAELREMGRKPSGTNQCCGRNCISRLASQHFDKIEDWRRRLEGSGQRVAQEIVAEVLRASTTSLDGQSNFCQNLVHWVTGCSFKKIRRVRDHLKKDPSSLPEHGLKKYWKDKVKNKPKHDHVQKALKTERKDYSNGDPMSSDINSFYGMYPPNTMPLQVTEMDVQYNQMIEPQYRSFMNKMPSKLTHLPPNEISSGAQASWSTTNHNNSNNMLPMARVYGNGETDIKPAHIQPMPPGYLHPMTTAQDVKAHPRPISNAPQSYPYNVMPENAPNMSHYVPPQNQVPRPYQDTANAANVTTSGNSHQFMNQQPGNNYIDLRNNDTTQSARESVIFHTAGSQIPSGHDEHMPYSMNPNAANTGRPNEMFNQAMPSNAGGHNDVNIMGLNQQGQQYYITNFADNEILQSNMSSGLTPFILSSGDPSMFDNNRNGDHYKHPFYILSPVPADGGFTAGDMKNLQHIPLTPVQFLHTPFAQSRNQEHGNSGKQDQFFFPLSLANAETFQGADYLKMNSAETTTANIVNPMHLPTTSAIGSLAVVPKGNAFMSWQVPPNKTVEGEGNADFSGAVSGKMASTDMYQCPPNITLEQPRIARDSTIPSNTTIKDRNSNMMETTSLQNFPPNSLPCALPGKQMDGNQNNPHVNTDKGFDQENEKDGDGIVTPKIIRDALSRSTGRNKKISEDGTAIASNEGHSSVNSFLPTPLKNTKDELMNVAEENEERCARINSRLKRFSRDRLRATIDSPTIVLTPFTPLTPSVIPVVLVPDSGEENPIKTGSDTSGQHKDGSVFQFPPTHVSRRRAAIRLQGPTISENGICKTKDPKDSPKTPGPFPVTDEDTSEKAVDKPDVAEKTTDASSKSPALMLRGIEQPIDSEKQSKQKLAASNTDSVNLTSPIDITDDDKLNTPNQPINTPTSLNTPTHLHTPNQELKTPTDSPLKPPSSLKRKREASPVNDGSAAEESGQIKSASAKNLRFHCFTPRDFTEGVVNCSAFRKPTEFASPPIESSILQRRRRPRKQARPSSVTNPEEGGDPSPEMDCQEIDAEEDNEKLQLSSGGVNMKPPFGNAIPYPILSRTQDGSFVMLGNTLDTQSPLLQMTNPSFLTVANPAETADGTQIPSQQLNTPILLQPAFVTPTGSGLLRKISPGSSQAGSANRSQVFTFLPGGLMTPNFQDKRSNDDDKAEEGKNNDNRQIKSMPFKIKASASSSQTANTDMAYLLAPHRESGLETPSHLKVVTPSLVSNHSAAASETPQIFNFPNMATAANTASQSSNSNDASSSNSIKEVSIASGNTAKTVAGSTKPLGPIVYLPIEMVTPSFKPDHSNDDAASGAPAAKVEDETNKDAKSDPDTANNTSAPTSSKNKSNLNPVVITPATMDGPNIQTPTMLNLVSPSQHGPSSPLVLYQMGKSHLYPAAKTQSPLSSANTSTPPLLILQRVGGTGSTSSLLKSAIMKNMPVFQFPPLSNPSSSNDSSVSNISSSTTTSTPSCDSVSSIVSSSATAVSVIRGPSQSTSSVTTEI